MCNQDKVQKVIEISKVLYDKSIDHGLPHIERVYTWALRIVKHEVLKVDLKLLGLAVYLHDLGRIVGEPHAYYSLLISKELLKEAECSDNIINEIITAIEAHSFSYSTSIRCINELGRILSDADKLDALGLVGFLRVFLYSAKKKRDLISTMNHFYEKILKLHLYMNYNYSKEIAELYTNRVKQLLAMLHEELSNNE